MYATSKLIIPAKTAQDSPYVPKIRIFLRPSSSLDKSSDMGSLLASDGLMVDVSKGNHSEGNVVEHGDKTNTTFPPTPPQNQTGKSKPPQDQVRSGRKRKLVGSLDNIDFERRDSLLTKVNLKKIINMDTFEALPVDSRRHLLSLLPIHDQTPPPNATALSIDADYWIHPTALNNEFLSKALQDYSTRQMNGEFSPRLNSRTGLRKSVGNRQRYLSPTVSPISIPHSSTSPLQLSANATKEEPSSTPLVATSSPLRTNGVESPASRFRNRSALQIVLAKEPIELKIENDLDKEGSRESINARLDKEQHVISHSVFSHFVPTSASSAITASSSSSSSSNLSSSPSPHCPSSSSPSSGLSPTASSGVATTTNPMLPLQSQASDELERSTMRPSSSLETSAQRRPNMPKLESTLLLQNGVKPPPDPSLSSPRRSTIGASSRKPSQTGTDFPSSSRPPLVVDSTTPTFVANPTSMPPPRETKTLASVREKLRAKRLMMSQQHPCQSQSPKVPYQQRSAPPLAPTPLPEPTTAPSPATGSLTPNPGNSLSSEFYSCPTTGHESVPPISAPVIQPSAVLIQPTGNSVSAPATPQHGSGGGGIAGPLPAILANFKQARVVVTPSRSGSSVSSNEGGVDVADPDQHLPDVHPQPHVIPQKQQQQQAIHQKQPVAQQPQQQLIAVPASACSVGGGTTTTRAFFVDGNNLTETLALLQSINPRATVTQQQFLLIPSTDKSHAILCRTPIAIQPKQTPPQPQVIRRHSGSTCTAAACPPASASATPTVLPLILPANRPQEHQQQVPTIPPGLYREILPNNNTTASACNVQRIHQSAPIQPQQQQTQLRPAQTYYSLLAPSTIGASGVNTNHNSVSGTSHNTSATNNNNSPTSFLPPPS